MARYDFTTHRLFVEAPLQAGARINLPQPAAHYLRNVLRLSDGAELLVFNGRDGEWRAALASATKKQTALDVRTQVRPQEAPRICITCSRRSSTPGSITWCRRQSRWAPACFSRS